MTRKNSKGERHSARRVIRIAQHLMALLLAISMTVAGTLSASAGPTFRPDLQQTAGEAAIIPIRFISPDTMDPTMPGVGTNPYSYSQNDPVNKSDPTGHICIPCGVAIGVIVSYFSSTTEANTPTTPEDIKQTTESNAECASWRRLSTYSRCGWRHGTGYWSRERPKIPSLRTSSVQRKF